MSLIDVLRSADGSFRVVSGYLDPYIIVVVIVLVGVILGGVVDSILRRFFSEVKFDDKISALFRARRNYARATRHTIVRLIYLSTALFALYKLGVLMYALYALVGLMGLLLLIKIVEFIMLFYPNAHVRFAVRARIRQGEVLTIFTPHGSLSGTVGKIGMIHTRVLRDNGDIFLVPHSTLMKSRFVRRKAAMMRSQS
jgi:hypothetical protein